MSKSKQKINHKFESRHRARELAAQFLYSMDLCPWQAFEPSLELFLGAGSLAETEPPEVKEYCRFLARGAWDRRAEADELLLRVVTGWRPERMVSVDRAILRLIIIETAGDIVALHYALYACFFWSNNTNHLVYVLVGARIEEDGALHKLQSAILESIEHSRVYNLLDSFGVAPR